MSLDYVLSCGGTTRTHQLTGDEIDAIGMMREKNSIAFHALGGGEFGKPVHVPRDVFLSSAKEFVRLISTREISSIRYGLEYELYPGYIEKDASDATGLIIGGKAANIEAGATCKLYVAKSIDAKGRATWDEGTDISSREMIITDSGEIIRISRKPASLTRIVRFFKTVSELVRQTDDEHVSVMIG